MFCENVLVIATHSGPCEEMYEGKKTHCNDTEPDLRPCLRLLCAAADVLLLSLLSQFWKRGGLGGLGVRHNRKSC